VACFRCSKVGATNASSLLLPIEVDGCHRRWMCVQLIYFVEIVLSFSKHIQHTLFLQACCRLRSVRSFTGQLQIASMAVFHRPAAAFLRRCRAASATLPTPSPCCRLQMPLPCCSPPPHFCRADTTAAALPPPPARCRHLRCAATAVAALPLP
jgi:hypothetical protein